MSRAQDPQFNLKVYEELYPECFQPHPEFTFWSTENARGYLDINLTTRFATFARAYGYEINIRILSIAQYEDWGFIYCNYDVGMGWKWSLIFELNLDKYKTNNRILTINKH